MKRAAFYTFAFLANFFVFPTVVLSTEEVSLWTTKAPIQDNFCVHIQTPTNRYYNQWFVSLCEMISGRTNFNDHHTVLNIYVTKPKVKHCFPYSVDVHVESYIRNEFEKHALCSDLKMYALSIRDLIGQDVNVYLHLKEVGQPFPVRDLHNGQYLVRHQLMVEIPINNEPHRRLLNEDERRIIAQEANSYGIRVRQGWKDMNDDYHLTLQSPLAMNQANILSHRLQTLLQKAIYISRD